MEVKEWYKKDKFIEGKFNELSLLQKIEIILNPDYEMKYRFVYQGILPDVYRGFGRFLIVMFLLIGLCAFIPHVSAATVWSTVNVSELSTNAGGNLASACDGNTATRWQSDTASNLNTFTWSNPHGALRVNLYHSQYSYNPDNYSVNGNNVLLPSWSWKVISIPTGGPVVFHTNLNNYLLIDELQSNMTIADVPFNYTASPLTGEAPLTVTLTASDVAYNPIWYDFGDGNQSWGNYSTSHTYTNIGMYTLTGTFSGTTITNIITVTSPEFYITVSPGWIPADNSQYLYGEVHAAPATRLLNITDLTWMWGKVGDPNSFKAYGETTNPLYTTDYHKSAGIFYGFDNSLGTYSVNKGATLPNPISLNPVGGIGTIQTLCYITLDTGQSYSFNVTNLIGGASNDTNSIQFITQDSVSSARIPNSLVSIKDAQTNNWTNSTTNNQGEINFTIPIGRHLNEVRATSPNYNEFIYPLTSLTVTSGMITVLDMTSPTISAKGNNLIVNVQTPAGQNANGAYVVVHNSTNTSADPYGETYYGTTDSNGKTFFSVINGTTYSITGSGGNYLSVTTIKEITTNPYFVYLVLGGGLTPIPTPTPIYITPAPTPEPIITPAGWDEGENTTCLAVLPPNSTLIDGVKNGIACAGAKDAKTQSLFLAGIIIMMFMLFGGRYGKGMGTAMGGIIGFVISLALDLIPFWVFAALLVLTAMAISGVAMFKGGK